MTRCPYCGRELTIGAACQFCNEKVKRVRYIHRMIRDAAREVHKQQNILEGVCSLNAEGIAQYLLKKIEDAINDYKARNNYKAPARVVITRGLFLYLWRATLNKDALLSSLEHGTFKVLGVPIQAMETDHAVAFYLATEKHEIRGLGGQRL